MRRIGQRAAVLAVVACLAIAGAAFGYRLTVPAAKRHAAHEQALALRGLTSVRKARVGPCARVAAVRVRCQEVIALRDIEGFPVTCRVGVLVTRRGPRSAFTTAFAARPRCTRDR